MFETESLILPHPLLGSILMALLKPCSEDSVQMTIIPVLVASPLNTFWRLCDPYIKIFQKQFTMVELNYKAEIKKKLHPWHCD